MVDELRATTTLHAPRSDVYELLRDVEGYGRYCEYADSVTRDGDGDVGTTYAVTLTWWRVTYDVRVRITELEPPARIGWRVVDGLEATGAWVLEPGDGPPVGGTTAVTLAVRYDPESGNAGLAWPAFVPLSAVVERARPVVEREAGRVVDRVVAELEGTPRETDLDIGIRRDVG